ncbi:hypothetical protein QUC32_23110 [Novosphingobium resinovorum]|uniref:hypothetical protein n=1 Tax=Novosphingobium TaxID=165696 RepID=UPI001B3C6439|nr:MULTISPECIES: hypothetical protein [Novosphingobium]MBF7012541.1 hypothetical protein [Novosphingobium sp. HR1a]WJM27275.1 hypothetical protein QUC32_23110 [Novosphingobium resinovorum]
MVHPLNVGEVEPARLASLLAHIAANLRDQDRLEMDAMHGLAPELVIPQAVLMSSHCWLAMDGEEPIAVFGAAPMALPGIGSVWFLGTDGVARCGRSVARQTVPLLDVMQETYSVLWNHIDARNTVSLRWLRWCGFRLLGEHHPPSGHLFHLFARSAAPCATL